MSKDVKELFPDCLIKEETWNYFARPSYTEIVETFGTIVFKSTVGSYQGTSFYILNDGEGFGSGRYGFLVFGWGSCSGCDALQRVESYAELQNFYERLQSNVVWKDTLEEFKAWFSERDWEAEFSYHEEGWREFFKQANEVLATEHVRALR